MDRLPNILRPLNERLPELLDDVADVLAPRWPAYAAVLTQNRGAATGAGVRLAYAVVAVANGRLTGCPDPGTAGWQAQLEHCRALGRAAARADRPAGDLQGVSHVVMMAAWRRLCEVAAACGLGPSALAALADGAFMVFAQLASAALDAFAEEHAAIRGNEHARDRLAELLLTGAAGTSEADAAALLAGWPLPQHAVVLIVHRNDEAGRLLPVRLGRACLVVRRERDWVAIARVSTPAGAREALARNLRDLEAAVGVPVPLSQLETSMQTAQFAAQLRDDGVLSRGTVFAEEHLDAMIVHRDPALLAALSEQVLSPLAGLPPPTRERLCATLASWLRHFGDRGAIAAELHVHPRTVAYRMAQLHRRFDTALVDPDQRARLALTLSWNPSFTERR